MFKFMEFNDFYVFWINFCLICLEGYIKNYIYIYSI